MELYLFGNSDFKQYNASIKDSTNTSLKLRTFLLDHSPWVNYLGSYSNVRKIFISLYIIQAVFIIITNIILLIFILNNISKKIKIFGVSNKAQPLSKTLIYFYLGVCFSDWLTGLVFIPLYTYNSFFVSHNYSLSQWWTMYKLDLNLYYIDTSSTYLSSLSILAQAVCRYIAIRKPFIKSKPNNSLKGLIAVIVISFSAPLIIYKLTPLSKNSLSVFDLLNKYDSLLNIYKWVNLAGITIPFVATIMVYALSMHRLHKSKSINKGRTPIRSNTCKKNQAIYLISILMIILFICIIPVPITIFYISYYGSKYKPIHIDILQHSVFLWFTISCWLVPLLIIYLNFKATIKQLYNFVINNLVILFWRYLRNIYRNLSPNTMLTEQPNCINGSGTQFRVFFMIMGRWLLMSQGEFGKIVFGKLIGHQKTDMCVPKGAPYSALFLNFQMTEKLNSENENNLKLAEAEEATNEIMYKFDIPIPSEEPKDRWNLVYFIILLHGIGVLLPWNMFVNANSYFVDYKLNPNITGTTQYKENFTSYLAIASQLPNVILNVLNLFLQFGGSKKSKDKDSAMSQPRIPIAISINVILCIFTVVLAMLDTTGWPKLFFIFTMITVVIMNSATGIYQNSLFGLVGSLPMKYTNSIVIGNNFCGTLIALVNILVIYAAPNPRLAAIWYFISAEFILLLCLDSYFGLPLLKFYRYSLQKVEAKTELINEDQESPASNKVTARDYLDVFKAIWMQCFGVFFTFFITLTLYPAIQVQIERYNPHLAVTDKYFLAVFCFLNFNLFSLLGSLTSEYIRVPGPKYVWIPIIVRVVFIPLFVFCNYRPSSRTVPVWFTNDWMYFFISALMGSTNGYFSSLTMMYAPKLVPPHRAPIAGMMAAVFLILGIFVGVNFSLVIPKIFALLH